MTLKVGDIVICHGWNLVEGFKGFIEEIVSDPAIEKNGLIFSGKYSVYGLEEAEFDNADRHYFGQFLGADLEETKKRMTVEELEKFKQHSPENRMIQFDIPVVIKNLGREMGRNEGRVESIESDFKIG